MANMPMAHNVAPVTATESGPPGTYQATLALEMQGRWTLRLEISGPLRDMIVATVDFGQGSGQMATPPEIEGYADSWKGET